MGLPIGLSVIWIAIWAIERIGDHYGDGVLILVIYVIFGALVIFSGPYTGDDGPLSCVT